MSRHGNKNYESRQSHESCEYSPGGKNPICTASRDSLSRSSPFVASCLGVRFDQGRHHDPQAHVFSHTKSLSHEECFFIIRG